MRRFARLYVALDATTKTSAKVDALTDYFRAVAPHDAAWATFFLTGQRLKRLVGSRDLRAAALAACGLPPWLFEASYDAVGDLAETISLVVPATGGGDELPLAQWVEDEIAPLAGLPPAEVQARLVAQWQRLDRETRFVHIKVLTGAFRVGVAQQLVYRALAATTGVAVSDVAARLRGAWTPTPDFFERLTGGFDGDIAAAHRPYPFYLAHALDRDVEALGLVEEWQAEWKWDGIRAQLLVRGGGASLWSRGDELVSDAFPEIVAAARVLPAGVAIDGELMAWNEGASQPLPFAALQRRLNRKAPGARLLRDVPVALVAYDLLELDGRDLRAQPLAERRRWLATMVPHLPHLRLSPVLDAAGWDVLAAARERARSEQAEGLMLKRLASGYGVGRVRGDWWKWKVDPYTIDAVLIYAQAGHGRRASLFTDYTFAVWDAGELVPFAKAYSGLDDAEIRAVDAWVRQHTLERFGPVRRVDPELVFELAFEGLQVSTRHKSGIAVRFPRIARWRRDKPASEADTLTALRALAAGAGAAPGP